MLAGRSAAHERRRLGMDNRQEVADQTPISPPGDFSCAPAYHQGRPARPVLRYACAYTATPFRYPSNIAATTSLFDRGRIAGPPSAIRIAQGRTLRRPWESPAMDRRRDTTADGRRRPGAAAVRETAAIRSKFADFTQIAGRGMALAAS